MRRTASKNRNAVVGILGVVLAALIAFFGYTKDNPFDDPFQIKAAFREVGQLRPNSPIRIAGITVGKVKAVEAGPGTSALVTMEIKPGGLPVKRDAQVKVRPRIFLEGNYFLDLKPGTPSEKAMKDGDTIPVQQTASAVQFGQLLEALQSDTREDLRMVLQQYGKAVTEGGRGFNRSIQYWRPAFQNSAVVNDATRGKLEHDLSNYLAGARRVAAGLDRDPERLKSLITDFAATAGALADEERNLSRAIDELPTTLRRGRSAFGALRRAFPSVQRLAPELEKTARTSAPALDAALPFVRELRGLVRPEELQGLASDLRPTVPALAEVNEGGVKLQEQARLLSSCQNTVVVPWNDSEIPDEVHKPTGKIYQEASKQFTGLAAESRSFDANGQYVRSYANNANYAGLVGDGRFFLSDLPFQGVNPPRKTNGAPPYRPEVPCETQEGPDLRSKAAPPPETIKIRQDLPGALERREKATEALMEFMETSLEESELGKRYDLSEKPLERAEIDDVSEDVPAMKKAIRDHARDFAAMLGLTVIALIVTGYLIQNQGVRIPVLEPEPFTLKAEFSTAQALTPGQGQTVRVAGVRVGDITKTELDDGRAVVTLELDEEFDDLVREDATALLRPKTGLKDMFIELDPGTKDAPVAKENWMLPVSSTLPDVNPDEFLAGLDTDTRDYLKLLLSGAGRGLKDNGDDLGEVLRRFEPTYRDLAAVTSEVSKRRVELRRLINSLQRLNTTLGRKDDDLAELVGASSRVFRAIASERKNVSATVRELPSALKQASQSLQRVEQLADVLGPTATKLRPAIVALRGANARTRPLALEAAPRLRNDIRPFVREARPLVRELRPAAEDLAEGEPGLTRSIGVLNRFFNMLAFNPNGREEPGKADRDEGYLFYTGWLVHQVNNLFGASDAHGPGRPITYGGTCAIIENTLGAQAELEAILGLTGALTDPLLCGGKSSTGDGGELVPELPELPIRGGAKKAGS